MKARRSSSMGLLIRQKDPNNLETPFERASHSQGAVLHTQSFSNPRGKGNKVRQSSLIALINRRKEPMV
jgi:hypothetical protein